MKKKKWLLPVCISAFAVVLCAVCIFAFDAVLNAQGYSVSTGRIYFADDGTYLIDGDDRAMLVKDCSANAELFKGLNNGDKIILFHDGVDGACPAQTGGSRIFRLSKGDGSYKPSDDVFAEKTLGLDEMFENAQKLDFKAQYIRTSSPQTETDYPQVTVISTLDELYAYYNTNDNTLGLGTINDSFFTAIKKYDDEFFEENALVLTLLAEGSGSTSHNVESVRVDSDGTMYVKILSLDAEVGTCDMAYWHIITETAKDAVLNSIENIVVYYNDTCVYNKEPQFSEVPENSEEEPFGLCGNTQTTIYFENTKTGAVTSYNFMGSESVTVTDILRNLEYDKKKMCKCKADYTVETEFGTYGVKLGDEAYARCDGGQSELTQVQKDKLEKIVQWAREKAK